MWKQCKSNAPESDFQALNDKNLDESEQVSACQRGRGIGIKKAEVSLLHRHLLRHKTKCLWRRKESRKLQREGF